ncbi:MraY family glycosyltransferase [Microbulbifer hydrolyticus]|uniref:UDP-N-acetylmuramyl pentapeptide phosphotransferase/UDP-N-acetylglucosamine-1-phosphate transferase n=1 Tax=Microbulbifer hydrolyticus TaxID=48074 RepID=A0A6P1TCV7_9GAMM|nr:glycosyltransferase family 4 protein [Microbulbifer hydrolyticus]MBB5210079.1 UDP-N-acetylmuramyl pentapeptide phosphotransferase/UDP-N-acetylglucosamine-1-phosphate transferase [Microbulbifer hydrolyticus]QHQ39400.1 UDP-phosphate N-acetylglucosaminyl 1-phosphate transferase [Microbulbifer hydrolyticus]
MGAVLDSWLVPLVAACAVTVSALWLILSRLRQFALDTPNHRSLHEVPVPRTGGLAVIAGVASGLMVSQLFLSPGILLAFLALFAVSLIDDLRPLRARTRFFVQVLSVLLVLYTLAPEVPHWLIWVPLLLGGVWVINLYNFMDGMDGFAGGMTAIGFASLGLISVLSGAVELAGICFLVAGCSVVFLYYNWPQARIFLGDAGSTVIGLAVFSVSITGWQQNVFHWLVPLLIFSPFWLDATVTLLIRVARGERWWEAHREHLYQRMALRFGVKVSLCVELSVMLSTSLMAVLLVVSGLV